MTSDPHQLLIDKEPEKVEDAQVKGGLEFFSHYTSIFLVFNTPLPADFGSVSYTLSVWRAYL